MANEIPLDILVRLDKSINDIQKFREKTESSLDSIQKSANAISFLAIGKAAIDAGKAMASAFSSFIDAANESEASLQKLNVSMRTAGDYSEKSLKSFQDFAKVTQAQTGIDDDLIIKNIALAKSFGFTNEEAIKVNKAAVELSAVTGQDLTSSIETLNAAYSGNIKGLSKMFPELRKFTDEQLAAGAATEFFNSRFAGTAESLSNTFAGALQKSSVAFSDLKETIGGFITSNPQVITAIKTQSTLFSNIEAILTKNKAIIQEFISSAIVLLIKGFELAAESVSGFLKFIGFIEKAFISLGAGFAKINAFLQLFNQATNRDKNLQDQFDDINKTGADAFNEINNKTAKRISLSDDLVKTLQEYSNTVKKATDADVNQVNIGNAKEKLSDKRIEQLALENKLLKEQSAIIRKQAIEQSKQGGIAGLIKSGIPTLKNAKGKAVSAAEQASFEKDAKNAALLGSASNVLKGTDGVAKEVTGILTEISGKIIPGLDVIAGPLLEAMSKGPEFASQFITGILNQIPTLIENLILSIPAVVEALANGIPSIIDRFIENIPVIIQVFIDKLPMIVISLATMMPMVATKLALEMPRVAVEWTTQLVKNIPLIVKGFVDEIGKQMRNLGGLLGTSGEGGGIGGFVGGAVKSIGKIFKFADGGIVPSGFPNDSAPALLTSGEIVLNKDGVDNMISAFNSLANRRPTESNGSQNISINLQVGEKQLADVLLQLNRNGFRTV